MLNGKKEIILTGAQPLPTANQTGYTVQKLPKGVRIHDLQVKATLPAGKRAADCFGTMRLRVGNVQREVDVTELDGFLALDDPSLGILGDVPGGGGAIYIPQPFTQVANPHEVAQEFFAFDNLGIVDAYLELQYKSLAAAPTFGVIAQVEDLAQIAPADRNVDKNGLPLLEKWLRTAPVAGGLYIDVDDLASMLKDQITAIHLLDPTTTGAINRVALQVEGEDIFDMTKDDVDQRLRRNGMFPVAGRFDLVPMLSGKLKDAFNMAGKRKVHMRVYFDVAAVGTVPIIVRAWGPLE